MQRAIYHAINLLKFPPDFVKKKFYLPRDFFFTPSGGKFSVPRHFFEHVPQLLDGYL